MPTDALHVRKCIATYQDGERFLVVQFSTGEDDGDSYGLIQGYHLKALHQFLGTIIAEHPELCGEAAEGPPKVVSEFQGRATDPKKARLN